MKAAGVAIGALAIALLTIAFRYLSFTDFSNDHFVHLSVAQQITMGALPVRDFVERGLPLMPLISAAGQVLLGEGLRSELWVIAIAYGSAAALTYLVSLQLSDSATVAGLGALLPVAVYPVSYSYPKLLAPALGFAAACWYCAKPDRVRAVLLAASIAVAFLLRHDLGVFLGVSVVAMMVAYHGLSRLMLVSAARVVAVAVLIVAPYLVVGSGVRRSGHLHARGRRLLGARGGARELVDAAAVYGRFEPAVPGAIRAWTGGERTLAA